MNTGDVAWILLCSAVATWAWAFVVTAIILWVIKLIMGLRVADNDGQIGLDLTEHGETAYHL